MHRYYPINLDIRGKRCIVVGGGSVAERKAQSLLQCGAKVTVVAPEVTDRLLELATEQAIELRHQPFAPGDLDGVMLAIGATDDATVNRNVAEEATRRGILLNVVDQPESCTFIVPAVCRFGAVTISISTEGISPALAKWIRERLEAEFGPYLGDFAALLYEVRDEVKSRYNNFETRRAAWDAILLSDALELLKNGRREDAKERILACISSPSD